MYSVDAVMQSTPYDGVASVLNSIGIDGMRIVTDATEQPKQDVIVENKQSAISDVAKLLYPYVTDDDIIYGDGLVTVFVSDLILARVHSLADKVKDRLISTVWTDVIIASSSNFASYKTYKAVV